MYEQKCPKVKNWRYLQVDGTTISRSGDPKFKFRPKYLGILRVFVIFLSPSRKMFELRLIFSKQLSYTSFPVYFLLIVHSFVYKLSSYEIYRKVLRLLGFGVGVLQVSVCCNVSDEDRPKAKLSLFSHKGVGRNGLAGPLILNIGTTWRWVFTFALYVSYLEETLFYILEIEKLFLICPVRPLVKITTGGFWEI